MQTVTIDNAHRYLKEYQETGSLWYGEDRVLNIERITSIFTKFTHVVSFANDRAVLFRHDEVVYFMEKTK